MAAIDNSIGVIGVAPGAPVVSVRVLDRRGSGLISGVIAGVDHVGANGNNIYTISAFSNGDNFASFSNFDNPPVDYASPGVSVLSTWKGGGYNTISGTSMAAPHFAGILLQGASTNDGTVNGDPDGTPDVIRVLQ